MIEKMRENRKEIFKKGDLAKLQEENMDAEMLTHLIQDLKPGIAYRVLSFEPTGDGDIGAIVWLGPSDLHPRDIDEFDPKHPIEFMQKKNVEVFPAPSMYLKKVLN